MGSIPQPYALQSDDVVHHKPDLAGEQPVAVLARAPQRVPLLWYDALPLPVLLPPLHHATLGQHKPAPAEKGEPEHALELTIVRTRVHSDKLLGGFEPLSS